VTAATASNPVRSRSAESFARFTASAPAAAKPIRLNADCKYGYDQRIEPYCRPEEDGVKTTIDIDPDLLREARKALGTSTIKGTVEASLAAVVRQRKLQALADALGTIDLDLTADRLRADRRKRTRAATR
jgi:Arc/MetJ family transcription regulator